MTELVPAMTLREIVIITSFYASARAYVEFGCGGSTVLATKLVKEKVITIDSDQTWLSKVEAACQTQNTKLRPQICFVDIGPTRELGYPADESRRDAWPHYHEQVWSMSEANTADLYMIDGRFRLACLLQVLLHAPADAIILIHDYVTRPHYQLAQHLTRELCRADDLAAFQRHPGFTREAAEALLLSHRWDTR